MSRSRDNPSRASNARLGLYAALFAGGMVGLAFASVPAYQLFCKVTGYGGTPKVATQATAPQVLARTMTVRFDASVNGTLPWRFVPAQGPMTVHVGEQSLAFYRAVNDSDVPITGTATFNVTPLKAAKYFTKIECFCFTEQTLQPGQTVDMPVTFYVDPAIVDDPHVSEVKTITLSYTFFKKEGGGDGGNS